jgi:hypothetical protein
MIIPTHWLNMLFKEQRPIVNCGLYMPHRIDHVFHRENPIEIRMITDGPLIKGFVIALQALDFTFIADELPRMRMLTLVNNCTYRPGQIEIENPGGTRIISIQWPNPGDSRRIVIGPNHI